MAIGPYGIDADLWRRLPPEDQVAIAAEVTGTHQAIGEYAPTVPPVAPASPAPPPNLSSGTSSRTQGTGNYSAAQTVTAPVKPPVTPPSPGRGWTLASREAQIGRLEDATGMTSDGYEDDVLVLPGSRRPGYAGANLVMAPMAAPTVTPAPPPVTEPPVLTPTQSASSPVASDGDVLVLPGPRLPLLNGITGVSAPEAVHQQASSPASSTPPDQALPVNEPPISVGLLPLDLSFKGLRRLQAHEPIARIPSPAPSLTRHLILVGSKQVGDFELAIVATVGRRVEVRVSVDVLAVGKIYIGGFASAKVGTERQLGYDLPTPTVRSFVLSAPIDTWVAVSATRHYLDVLPPKSDPPEPQTKPVSVPSLSGFQIAEEPASGKKSKPTTTSDIDISRETGSAHFRIVLKGGLLVLQARL